MIVERRGVLDRGAILHALQVLLAAPAPFQKNRKRPARARAVEFRGPARTDHEAVVPEKARGLPAHGNA